MWPDNVIACNVFTAMSTQWSVGPGGPVGLRYETLPELWRRCKVPPSERDDVFQSLRVMEDAALSEMRKG